ncbi:MAG: FAD-binding oxidoreductase [Bradymonadaceae bacterium]
MSDDGRRESFWGWGWADKFPGREERRNIGSQARQLLGIDELELHEPPELSDIELEEPAISPPDELIEICTVDKRSRARHTYGRGYRDIVRGFHGQFDGAPDVVAEPTEVDQIRRLLDWASSEGVAVIPFGGGTSVVGGVEASAIDDEYRGVVSLDTRRMHEILEFDPETGAARIQAGATGPQVAAQLEETGQMLRHYPQSYEFSTVGGWIATRSGGHYATIYTHFEDFVESVRMVAPDGEMVTPRHPASGAGPDPDRLVAGSEGILGVITDAWVRTQDAPDYRSKASVYFSGFDDGVAATRALARSGLHPANCRLLDGREAMLNGIAFDGSSILLVGFESANVPTREAMDVALELARDFGGQLRDAPSHRTPEGDDGADSGQSEWRASFFEAPYLQNTMVSLGVLADTFETACTWGQFDSLHERIVRTTLEALEEVCGDGFVSCRFTHVYPDGPAPYYTFLGPAEVGSELDQWAEVKSAVSDVLSEMGATITHHHAVGRTHRPWYDDERPDLFAEGLEAARSTFDPARIMNPGVLL